MAGTKIDTLGKSKITAPEAFAKIRQELKAEGKVVVHCHGVFDLVHPGHIVHLEEARSMGDVLVVSVTAARYVNKGPGRPYFNDEVRLHTLEALSCVDFVILSEAPTAIPLLDIIMPDIYVKGKEFERDGSDVTGHIDVERAYIEKLGGVVRFTSDEIVFSSTRLLNNNMPVFSDEVKDYVRELLSRYSYSDIQAYIERFSRLKVLVVGDIIFDEYVYCTAQGLISKDLAVSARYLREERHLGGALAVARHLSSFCGAVSVCSLIGSESHLQTQIINEMGGDFLLNLHTDAVYQTPVKRRYLSRYGQRDEYTKLFSVNYILGNERFADVDRGSLIDSLAKNLPNYDVVFVADYGHGLIDNEVMDILQRRAPFLALNCQTNSSNTGENIITKYTKVGAFTLDERELKFAFNFSDKRYDRYLKQLRCRLSAAQGWLTLGSYGAMSVDGAGSTNIAPALTLSVVDTIGAGDAFFAMAGLCAVTELPAEVGALLGNIAGALAANYLGNSMALAKGTFLKYASTVMNF
jgi:rfaE bifunctional protein nucleotidyltransferase chain/domain